MHKYTLRRLNTNKNESWITREHNRSFISWLKDHIHAELAINPSSISDRLRWLASGPSIHVFSYSGYMINGYTFYTKEQDDQITMQNSGVTLIAESMHISSAKDRTPQYANMSYFGVIDRIWELDYTVFRLPVFGCKWVDNNNGIRVDESGFMLVNLNRVGYKDEPFILASQGQQVFYVTDPADKNWYVVLLTNKINDHCNQNQEDTNNEDDPFPETSQLLDIDPTIDDILYMRNDHDDGIWIDPPFSVTKRQKNRNTSRKRKR